MIQVRHARDGTRTHIEILTGNSSGRLHAVTGFTIDHFNGATFLAMVEARALLTDDIEIIEIDG